MGENLKKLGSAASRSRESFFDRANGRGIKANRGRYDEWSDKQRVQKGGGKWMGSEEA